MGSASLAWALFVYLAVCPACLTIFGSSHGSLIGGICTGLVPCYLFYKEEKLNGKGRIEAACS